MEPHTVTQITGNLQNMLQGGLGCLGAAIGVGLVGSKAVEAVGRNPSAFPLIMTMGVLGMVLAEAVAFYALLIK